MSSFAITDVNVAPAVPLLSDTARRGISNGLNVAGMAAVSAGTAAVAVGAAAGTAAVLGTGWVLYASGKLAYNEMKRTKRRTEEKEQFLRIYEEQRCHVAQEERKQILKKCAELKEAWGTLIKKERIDFSANQTIREAYTEIQKIEQYILEGTAEEMENENLRHWEYLNQTAEYMENFLKKYLENLSEDDKRKQMLSILENLHEIVQTISLNKNASSHDVKGRSVEEERFRKLKRQTEKLAARLEYAVEKEKQRELQMPVEERDKAYLHHLLDGADEMINTLLSSQISMEQKEYLLEDFEKRLYKYHIKEMQLNEKEERFECLYDIYCEVIQKMGENPKAPTEFVSLQELEYCMEKMKKRVKRLEECAEIYRNIGREAYICMAFDTEMENLGYKMAERKQAQQFVPNQLKNAKTDGILIPYYSMPEHSLTQFYHFGESTCVQVMVRADGTTSLETFTISGKIDRDSVVKEQKEHCKLNKELERALREKWFIISNLTEVHSPEMINVRGQEKIENPTYVPLTEGWNETEAYSTHTHYQSMDQ